MEHDAAQSSSLEQSPNPTCGTGAGAAPAETTLSRGCIPVQLSQGTGPWKGDSSATSLPLECLGHQETFNGISKDRLEEPVPCYTGPLMV